MNIRWIILVGLNILFSTARSHILNTNVLARKVLGSLIVCSSVCFTDASILRAVDNPIVYKSGKNPIPIDKNDPKAGTRKDIKFLRCLSACKAKSELPSAGLASNRFDAIQVCQDQCCETYEQCSFKINIGASSSGGV